MKIKIVIADQFDSNIFRLYFDELFNGKVSTTYFNKNNISELINADCVVFPGGEDVTPEIYKEKNTDSNTNFYRDVDETFVLQLALRYNKKIFGVCRGHQFINASLGGKLKQDLYHKRLHELEIVGKSLLNFKGKLVNSLHHQGVVVTGDNLIPLAYCKDHDNHLIVEVARGINYHANILSVQFHPEYPEFPRETSKVFDPYLVKFLEE